MAQFDVYRLSDGILVVDVQSDLIDIVGTRFVIPLIAPDDDAQESERLNPPMNFSGETYVLATQFAASIPRSTLGRKQGSLVRHEYAIKSAFDMLISGY